MYDNDNTTKLIGVLGAGSGGSILLKAQNFIGYGHINANGGDSDLVYGLAGEGSGGIITINNLNWEKNIESINFHLNVNRGIRKSSVDKNFLGDNGGKY